MENKKITNVSALEFVLTNYELPKEYHEKLKAMKETFERKNSHKSNSLTPTQKENIEIKENILANMEKGKKYQAGEIAKLVSLPSNQKASALLKQLVDENLIEKTVEKRVSYFSLLTEPTGN